VLSFPYQVNKKEQHVTGDIVATKRDVAEYLLRLTLLPRGLALIVCTLYGWRLSFIFWKKK
jgi:hypothetical protein